MSRYPHGLCGSNVAANPPQPSMRANRSWRTVVRSRGIAEP